MLRECHIRQERVRILFRVCKVRDFQRNERRLVNCVRCLWMRGGTSKGGYFLAEDLPADTAARDAYLPHPEHVALGQTLLRPIADDVLVMDYAI